MTAPKRGLRIPRWVNPAMLVVGLALLVFVVSRYPFGDVFDSCRDMWPGVALTPLIALAWFACGSTTTYILLERRVPWLHVLWIRLVGDSYNSLLPLGGFGGEPFKIRQLTLLVEPAIVMTALIRDRIVDNAMGFSVSAAGVAIGLSGYTVDPRIRVALIGYAIVAGILGVLGAALVLTRLPGKVGGWLAKFLGDVKPEQISTVSPARLAQLAVFTFGARSLGLVEIGTLLWILGLPHDLVTVAFVDSFLNAAGYIGFFIPQGLGVFEASSAWLFTHVLNAPGQLGIAFAFARRGRMLVVGLFGVSLHLVVLVRHAMFKR